MRDAPRPAPAAALAFVVVTSLAFANGGFDPTSWVWAGALAGWAAAMGLLLRDSAGMLRTAWAWPVLFGALAAWTLASLAWSARPSQSLLDARRDVVYVAIVLALVVLAGRGATWGLAQALHAAIALVVAVALVRYLLGARRADPFEGHDLFWPLGYANAAGILCAAGIVLALAPAVDGAGVLRRAWGAGTLPVFAAALELTGSDASWAALALGLLVAAALTPRPAATARVLAPAAVPAVAVAALAWVGSFSQRQTPRFSGALLLLGVVVAAGAAGFAPALARRSSRTIGRRAVAVFAVVLAAAGVAAVAVGASTQPRRSYYHVAWHEYTAHPLLGSGAATFGRFWLASGLPVRYGGALDAHSLYLETLAELGPLGLALLVAGLAYPFRGVLRARSVPGLPATAGAATVFLAHAAVDWDWEVPAVVAAGLACLAAVLLADESRLVPRAPSWLRAAALATALVLGGLSLAGAASSTKPNASRANCCRPAPCRARSPCRVPS